MVYTSGAKVLSQCSLLGSLSETTRVTAEDLDGFILDVEAEIDVALMAVGYAAPYTETGAFLTWLGKLASDGAAATLLKAWFTDTSGPNSENSWNVFERRYRDGLKGIRDRTMIPVALGEGRGSLPGGLTATDAPPSLTMSSSF